MFIAVYLLSNYFACALPCYLFCLNFTGSNFEGWSKKWVYLFDMKQLFYYKTAWMGFFNHTHTV